jgi:hypothetical protein
MNFKFKVLVFINPTKGFVFGQELPTTMVRIVFELRNII